MTHTEQMRAQFERGGAGEIQIVAGDLQARVRLADWDRLGCLLERLELRHTRGLPLHIAPASVEKAVTYLGETLRVIETEEARGRALLRSAPPSLREGRIAFFEMVLDRGEGLSLARYVYDRERQQRQSVPAPLTRHALEHLLDDLLALAGSAL